MPRPLYPRERAPGIHWKGGWVSPRASLDVVEKILDSIGTRTMTPPSSNLQPVAIPTELSCLSLSLTYTCTHAYTCMRPLWDLQPDINSVSNLLSCLCRAPPLMRGQVCLLSVTVSSNCPSSSFFFPPPPFCMSHVLPIYNICKASAQAQYSRSCSIICSLYYNSSLNTSNGLDYHRV
jgi:hypothetical protein